MLKQQLPTVCTLVVCIALPLCPTKVVYADPATTTSVVEELSSEQHIEQAQALFKEQKFSDAADHLMSAYEREPKAVLLFHAGQAYRKALRPVEAKSAYQKLVTTYPEHPLVPEAKGYIQTLDALIVEIQAKQQIELSLMEQKAKSEKELAQERGRREAVQKEGRYGAPNSKMMVYGWGLLKDTKAVGALATPAPMPSDCTMTSTPCSAWDSVPLYVAVDDVASTTRMPLDVSPLIEKIGPLLDQFGRAILTKVMSSLSFVSGPKAKKMAPALFPFKLTVTTMVNGSESSDSFSEYP